MFRWYRQEETTTVKRFVIYQGSYRLALNLEAPGRLSVWSGRVCAFDVSDGGNRKIMVALCNLQKPANLQSFLIFLERFKTIHRNYDGFWRTRKHSSNLNRHCSSPSYI
jgi:hypothetical protein